MFAILHALGMFVADFSSRGTGLKLKTCFFVISSASLCEGHHRVVDCATLTGRYSY
jgi:hypothetical protein